MRPPTSIPTTARPGILPLRFLTPIGILTGLLGTISSVTPAAFAEEPKRVIIVTVTTGFRHSSIETAEKTIQKLAHETKDFMITEFLRQPDIVVPRRPIPPEPLAEEATDFEKKKFEADSAHYQELLSGWTPEDDSQSKKAQDEFDRQMTATLENLKPSELEKDRIDGVILLNTSGDLPLPDKQGFLDWVEKGHALIGIHSAADTLRKFAPYVEMLGGEMESHGSQSPLSLQKLDPNHPATLGIKGPWNIKLEEFFHIKSYDRSRVRDIWAAKVNPLDKLADQGRPAFFPVSWVRSQGTGRIFYTSLGHRQDMWDDSPDLPKRVNPPEVAKAFQTHVLGGIRWALGLVDGESTPLTSPAKTP